MSTKIIDIEETIFELERISGEITSDLESMYKQLIRFGSICCEYEQEMEPQSVENLEKMYNEREKTKKLPRKESIEYGNRMDGVLHQGGCAHRRSPAQAGARRADRRFHQF